MSMVLNAIVADPALPTLADALDPRIVGRALTTARRFAGARVVVGDARLTRHKPGKRCVIEYGVEVVWPDGHQETFTAIGKMRAGHEPGAASRRLKRFWRAGFASTSADGISVPQPLGSVPALGLWLQRKVPGVPATGLLGAVGATDLPARIAAAARKVHAAQVPTERTHSMARELEILARVLTQVGDRPGWARPIARLLTACAYAAQAVSPRTASIHRDFYADQVMVDGPRLYLLDFDLYCQGPVAVDLGNFVGHVAEQAVREPSRAGALAGVEAAFERDVLVHEGEMGVRDLRILAALTLARHAYLSTVIAERERRSTLVLEAALARVEACNASI